MHLYDLTVFWQIASMLQLSSTSAHSSTSGKGRKTGVISSIIAYTKKCLSQTFATETKVYFSLLYLISCREKHKNGKCAHNEVECSFLKTFRLTKHAIMTTKVEPKFHLTPKFKAKMWPELQHSCGYKLGQVIFKIPYYYYFQRVEFIYFSSWTSVELLQMIN